MKPFTVAIPYSPETSFEKTLLALKHSALIERFVIVTEEPVRLKMPGCHLLVG